MSAADAMRLPLCPDCAGQYDAGRTLRHDDSCPVGRDLDESSAGDRDYFARHPHVPGFTRDLTWGESVLFAAMFGPPPPGWRLTGPVLVQQVAPGVRSRDYGRIVAVPSGETG